jgi:hypothetical protein
MTLLSNLVFNLNLKEEKSTPDNEKKVKKSKTTKILL